MKLILTLLACASVAGAQSPGPELQKLAYYIGTWHAQAEQHASMFGPAGKVTNTTQNEWMLNNHFYITHHEEHNPSGTFQMVNITGYDPTKKVYVEYDFDASGAVWRTEGTLTPANAEVTAHATGDATWAPGDKWTWTSEFPAAGGKAIKSRGINTVTSANSYDFVWQISTNGGTDWQTIQSGTSTKAP